MPTSCEQTVAEYFAAIRAMDADRWVATFTPDAVSHDPVGAPPHRGHQALHSFLSGVGSMFDELALTEDSVFVNGDSAAVKWTGTGLGKNGAKVAFEGIDVIECNPEGKIVLVHAFWDPGPVLAAVQS